MDNVVCPICLTETNMLLHSTTICNHRFHSQCLHKWLQIDSTCPLCRYPLSLSHENDELKNKMYRIMKKNLHPNQYQCVVELDTLYNLSYYPLSNSSFESMNWLPPILQT